MGVVNRDQGPLGAAVARQLERSEMVRASELDQSAAEAQLDEGKLAGYVVLASDFSARALREQVLALELSLEGSQPSNSSALVQALSSSLLGAVSSLPGGAVAPRVEVRVS
jgi:hypothetical protein